MTYAITAPKVARPVMGATGMGFGLSPEELIASNLKNGSMSMMGGARIWTISRKSKKARPTFTFFADVAADGTIFRTA